MPRRKKVIEEPPQPSQPGMMQVEEKRIYRRPIDETPAPQPASQTAAPPAPPAPPDEEPEDDRSKLENFFDSLDEEQSLRLRIDCIPLFGDTGKAGRGSAVEYCGVYTISASALANEEYLTWVQNSWGGGTYRFTLKNEKGQILRNWSKSIRSTQPTPSPLQPVASLMPANPKALPAPADPMAELIRQAKQMAELRKYLVLEVTGAAAPSSAPASQPDTGFNLSRIAEIALTKALEKGDEATAERLFAMATGQGSNGGGFVDILKELFTPLMPYFGQLMMNAFQNSAVANGATIPPGSVTGTAPPAPQQPNPLQLDSPFARLCKRVANDCLDGFPVELAVEYIDTFAERHTDLHPQLGFLATGPIDMLAAQLGLPDTSEVKLWLTGLQTELKNFPEDTGNEQQQSGVATD